MNKVIAVKKDVKAMDILNGESLALMLELQSGNENGRSIYALFDLFARLKDIAITATFEQRLFIYDQILAINSRDSNYRDPRVINALMEMFCNYNDIAQRVDVLELAYKYLPSSQRLKADAGELIKKVHGLIICENQFVVVNTKEVDRLIGLRDRLYLIVYAEAIAKAERFGL